MQNFLSKRLIVLLNALAIFCFSSVFAQIPPGYYDDAQGLYGDELREALYHIINDHTVVSSGAIWQHFEATDQKPDGTVWDMYSDQPGGVSAYIYEFVTDQCGNYSQEGDCFNREHSFPQSWYSSASPMSTDLFHIYPTDGYVNGIRGNFPYGTVGNTNHVTTNGSKRGTSNWPGYSGIVFEPIDEYKGDFARTFFYMLTRYYPQISGWESDMLSGDNFSGWAREILLQWAEDDPVSQKEIDRNNAVYNIQGNRNPFIDISGFAHDVWIASVGQEEYEVDKMKTWYSNGVIRFIENGNPVELVTVINTTGQVIRQKQSPSGEFNLNGITPGIYVAVFRLRDSVQLLRFVAN